jgi:hypothetical protein
MSENRFTESCRGWDYSNYAWTEWVFEAEDELIVVFYVGLTL